MRRHRATAKKVQRLGKMAAKSFRLKLLGLRINEAMKSFGECTEDGNVEIRLTNLRDQALLTDGTIIDTLAHELAHLDNFDHSRNHRALTSAIKVWLQRRWH